MAREVAYTLQGLNGSEAITSASGSVTGNFRGFLVIADAVVVSYGPVLEDGSRIRNHTVISDGRTLATGLWIGGQFREIELGSGAIIAYDI